MIGFSLSPRHASAAAAPAAWWRLFAMLVGVGGSAAILLHFHDWIWWGPDEGAYAHVAQRILRGEVLNRDVQDMHAGYINFVNALAFYLFGEDLLSLRYPLVFLGIVQAFLVFHLIELRGTVAAAATALALTSLSFVQFLNPTANWYALFLAILVTWSLVHLDRKRPFTIEMIGFLLATTFLFRQLTGAIVAMGAVAWLLLETDRHERRSRGWIAPAIFALMALGLTTYLLRKNDVLDWLLFGLWPLAILIRAGLRVRLGNSVALRLIGRLSLGGATGLLPLVIYHLWHGSLASWFNDTVGGALALSDMPFTRRPFYGAMIILSLRQLIALESLAQILNALLWLTLLAIPAVNGVTAFRATDDARTNAATRHPLLLMAVFHGLASTFHQLPLYLMTSSGFSLAALIWASVARGPRWRLATVAGTAAIAVIALHYQAAEPVRLVRDYIAGTRSERPVESTLLRVSLKIDPADSRDYRRLIDLIERETPTEAAILAVPFDPQLYFVSGRRNPVRFYNTAIGIRDEESLRATLDALRLDPPQLLFYRANDKYNTALSRRLIDVLLPRYEPIDRVGDLDVYRRR